ncbi:hypothetical protein EOS_02820 [Caballeronia mineralivorans PML1(12)]|uniref:Tat pathway signal sequence n=1 Tax=Caballeronia mineralivorans PML1(12) TaxID=908627 RepID=A0A0J1D4U5_9BURK|nr:DUF6622 family protein [Caballeronia mineralivorans]KLU27737.1 hypothetical protein EOS_02820 [Caballeronia mineralivorans PML1(12)]
MLNGILQHTPHWVWGALAVLVSLGIKQTLPRRRTLCFATAVPIAMTALSFYGVMSVFAQQSIALAAWAAAVLAAVALSHAVGVGSKARRLASEERLLVPGSWVPMMLILGLFVIRFGANIMLAIHPDLGMDTLFAISVSFAYGAFSGVFLARGLAMWRIARQAQLPSMAY